MPDTSTSTTIPTKPRKWLLIQVLAVFALFGLAAWYYVDLSRSIVPRGEVPKGIDTSKPYFEASFTSRSAAEPSVAATTTFYIPKAYVEYDGIDVRSDGSYAVPIRFELPEKTPSSLAPPRPWHGLEYRSPEAEALRKEFYKTHHGSFRLTLNIGGFDPEKFLQSNVKDATTESVRPHVQISSIAGLLRYAKLDCLQPFAPGENEEYKKGRLQDMANKRAQSQPDDPPVPTNCAIDRNFATLFTPPGTPEEEQLYVVGAIRGCDGYVCNANIRIAGVPARLHIPQELLPRWREIVQPTQALVRSFLVKPEPIAAASPAAPAPNPVAK